MTKGIKFSEVEPIEKPNIIIVCSGPSLQGFDFNKLKHADNYIITVNDAGKHVNFADAWFTLDPWGLNRGQLPPRGYAKKLFVAVPDNFGRHDCGNPNFMVNNSSITYLHRLASHNLIGVSSDTACRYGLSKDTSCISTGNSGYGALNLAYHMRPKKILLLGIDGTKGYFYNKTINTRPLSRLPALFDSAIPMLEEAGIETINGSKNSIVRSFPRYDIDEALEKIL